MNHLAPCLVYSVELAALEGANALPLVLDQGGCRLPLDRLVAEEGGGCQRQDHDYEQRQGRFSYRRPRGAHGPGLICGKRAKSGHRYPAGVVFDS